MVDWKKYINELVWCATINLIDDSNEWLTGRVEEDEQDEFAEDDLVFDDDISHGVVLLELLELKKMD